jgi:hypothetical protein
MKHTWQNNDTQQPPTSTLPDKFLGVLPWFDVFAEERRKNPEANYDDQLFRLTVAFYGLAFPITLLAIIWPCNVLF